MARKIKLFSPHAPIPLARILDKEMDREWTQQERNKGRIMGSGTEHKIALRFQRYGMRNDFSTRFSGTMEAERGGTLIKAKMGTARGVSIFMIFWLGFVGFFLLNSLFVLNSTDAPFLFKAMFTGVPAVMFLAGLAMVKFGRRNTGDHEEKILAFLEEKVKARVDRSPD